MTKLVFFLNNPGAVTITPVLNTADPRRFADIRCGGNELTIYGKNFDNMPLEAFRRQSKTSGLIHEAAHCAIEWGKKDDKDAHHMAEGWQPCLALARKHEMLALRNADTYGYAAVSLGGVE